MVKQLKKLFRNLIVKSNSNSRLEIDAAVVSSSNINDEEERQQQQQQQHNERNDSEAENIIDRYVDNSQNNIVPYRMNSVVDIHPESQLVPGPATNLGEINNVNNVYNFSNIDGLHIGNSMIFYNNTNNTSNNNRNNNNRDNTSRNVNSTINRNLERNESNNNNNINYSEKFNQNKIKITPGIDILFRSRDDVEESVLNELSEFIGNNYPRVMRNLGFTQAQIEVVELDYNCLGHKEIIFQLLIKWSEEFFENANYGKLSRNLWRCDCREAVVKLEQILSRNKLEHQNKSTENIKCD